MNRLLDLRFVIGIFFIIVGLLLLIYHFTGKKDAAMDTAVNLNTGIVFLLFGVFMIFISLRKKVE